MSDFKAKIHQIRFGRGSAPDPARGARAFSRLRIRLGIGTPFPIVHIGRRLRCYSRSRHFAFQPSTGGLVRVAVTRWS